MLGWAACGLSHEQAHRVDDGINGRPATKVATRVGCQFCIDIGAALGRKAGVTEKQLRELHEYRTSAEFSDEERVAIEYAEELTKEHVDVPDELFGRLRRHFDEAQSVGL